MSFLFASSSRPYKWSNSECTPMLLRRPIRCIFPLLFFMNLIKYKIVKLEHKTLFSSIFLLVKYIKRYNIDIIHTHGYRANFYGRLASILSNKRVVSTLHVSLYDYADTPGLIRKLYIAVERILSFKTKEFICISRSIKEDAVKLGIPLHKIHLIPISSSLILPSMILNDFISGFSFLFIETITYEASG